MGLIGGIIGFFSEEIVEKAIDVTAGIASGISGRKSNERAENVAVASTTLNPIADKFNGEFRVSMPESPGKKIANTGKKPTSTGWIIFWFILFWPIGLYLLIKRSSVDKSATMKSNKPLYVVSYILILLGVMYLIMAFSVDTIFLAGTVIFGGGGVIIYCFARKTKRTGERYRKYISLIVNQNQTSIDNIASAVGVSYNVTAKELQKMIDSGYFVGAYIDTTERDIVLAKTAQPQASVSFTPSTVQLQERVVVCGSCGANNKVIGQVGECEYCGSHL